MPLGGPGLACEQCIAKKGAAFGALVCLHGHQQQLSPPAPLLAARPSASAHPAHPPLLLLLPPAPSNGPLCLCLLPTPCACACCRSPNPSWK